MDDDAADALPGGQATHVALKKLLAAVPLDALPAGHAAHTLDDVAFVALELVPRGQGAQSDPGAALKDPDGQTVHAVAPGDDEEPGGHGTHTLVPSPAA